MREWGVEKSDTKNIHFLSFIFHLKLFNTFDEIPYRKKKNYLNDYFNAQPQLPGISFISSGEGYFSNLLLSNDCQDFNFFRPFALEEETHLLFPPQLGEFGVHHSLSLFNHLKNLNFKKQSAFQDSSKSKHISFTSSKLEKEKFNFLLLLSLHVGKRDLNKRSPERKKKKPKKACFARSVQGVLPPATLVCCHQEDIVQSSHNVG